MKLKKGSKAAKDFMAKIRSMKNKPKKSKVGAVKRSTRKLVKNNTSVLSGTHKDTKSHNYKISISGINKDNLQNLKERLDFNDTLIKFIADLEDQQKKGKYTLTFEQKNAISKHKRIAKKQLINNLKQIQLIKKSI